MKLWLRSSDHPRRKLITLFWGWKTLLLLIALCSPGPGYDTSASLDIASHNKDLPIVFRYVASKLVRWDAIYFTKVANRGYLFEQEWAFGWGFTRLIAFCTTALRVIGLPLYNGLEGAVAICVAHLAHLISVLVLFSLTLSIFPTYQVDFAFITASLQIISPAGLFLSAPYAESSCACLIFAGILFFSKSLDSRGQSAFSQNAFLLMSGLLFGIATTFRSNAILNGLFLLEEAFRILLGLLDGIDVSRILRLIVTGVAGLSVGVGFVLPQYIAYSEYCGADVQARPWCSGTLPSIYTFVQDHYWNVGLFRYWTLSNLPLFLLGAPMFMILAASGVWALSFGWKAGQMQQPNKIKSTKGYHTAASKQIILNLAIQQLLLVLITLTTAHVQIISRLASAYPVWLWYGVELCRGNNSTFGNVFIRYMVIYAIVQGGLYASFLPPA